MFKKLLLLGFILFAVDAKADCTGGNLTDSSGRAVTANRLFLARVTMPCTGNLDSVQFYAHNSDGINDTMISAIYLASSRALMARSVDSVILTTTGYLLYHCTFTGVTVTATTAYWIGEHVRVATTGSAQGAHRGTTYTGAQDSTFLGDDVVPLESNLSGTTSPNFYAGNAINPPRMIAYITTATGQASVVIFGGNLEGGNFGK